MTVVNYLRGDVAPLTCEYENSRPVTENITSPAVMKKYCGICRAIGAVLGFMYSISVMDLWHW